MGDLTKTRLGNYDPSWTAAGGSLWAMGFVDRVTPNITIVTKDIKVGSVGDVVLGKRIIAVTGTVRIEAREVDLTAYQKLMPWYSSGSIPLNPATIHKDLYDYAGLLTLHPTDVSGTGQDLSLVKAVPLITPMDRNGNDDDRVIVDFHFFPDRTQLPTLVYGYVGPVPS